MQLMFNSKGELSAADVAALGSVYVWSSATEDNLLIEPLSGGLSNKLFLVRHRSPQPGEPSKCVLRVRVGYAGSMRNAMWEPVISALLGAAGLGPAILAFFENGSFEEYIEGTTLKYEQLADAALRREIASTLRNFHNMALLPIRKKIKLFEDMRQMYVDAGKMEVAPSLKADFAALLAVDFPAHVDWLEQYLATVPRQVVVCHNDYQEGNIIQGPARLRVIDFEYVSYNYREFDIGNFFCEMSLLNSHPQPPHFVLDEAKYPTRAERAAFVRAYLGDDAGDDEVSRIAEASRKFSLASHLIWSLWAMVSCTAPIQFGYLEYARQRVGAFERLKSTLLAEDACAAVAATTSPAVTAPADLAPA